jgi:hypothetical protein
MTDKMGQHVIKMQFNVCGLNPPHPKKQFQISREPSILPLPWLMTLQSKKRFSNFHEYFLMTDIMGQHIIIIKFIVCGRNPPHPKKQFQISREPRIVPYPAWLMTLQSRKGFSNFHEYFLMVDIMSIF